MNYHDGIPFLKLGKKGNEWYINPRDIIRVVDATERDQKARNLGNPSCIIYLHNHSQEGLGIDGWSAAQCVEKLNSIMLDWKNKLADKAILE